MSTSPASRATPSLGAPPVSAGAVVMAIGIFVLAALQRMPFPVGALTRALALLLFGLWFAIALPFLIAFRRGTLSRLLSPPISRFAAGTWVAGTGVLTEVLIKAFPGWRAPAAALALLTLLLWLWFLTLAARAFRALLVDPARYEVTGAVLLPTVATQALVLVAQKPWPGQVPHWLSAPLIVLGYLFYLLGLALIVQRVRRPGWRPGQHWDSTHCIIHGAMSISGLAGVLSSAMPAWVVVTIWLWVAAMFVLVEGIEVRRAIIRVRAYGWRRGVCEYHVSQWARNFTFGMYYAFTAAIRDDHAAARVLPGLTTPWDTISRYGQYVVLALLLLEAGLFLSTRLRRPQPICIAGDPLGGTPGDS